MDDRILHREISYRIVGLAMQVHTELGYGFLEKIYENALAIMFEENGIGFQQQMPIKVLFHGRIVGDYIADFVVENSIILELKAAENLNDVHRAQTLNYLKATGFRLAYLLNFGKRKLEHTRLIL
jgi:GxxExxY protein